MTVTGATSAQIQRLQVLYSQAHRHAPAEFKAERAARIAWAAALVKREPGHEIASFSDLSLPEAGHLIDALQAQLGIERGAAERSGRKFIPHSQAHRAGTDGRFDSEYGDAPQIARAEDLNAIERLRLDLNWTKETFDRWLYSKRSPIRGSKAREIRTTAQANSVIWALKAMLRNGTGTSARQKRGAAA